MCLTMILQVARIYARIYAGGGGGGGLRGPNPYPILGKAGDSENIPYFREISQSRAPEAVRTPKTYPILGKIS